jgi:hypothetical protein
LKVAEVIHEGGGDGVYRCVHCAVRTSPVVLWDGEEGCAFEVEPSRHRLSTYLRYNKQT